MTHSLPFTNVDMDRRRGGGNAFSRDVRCLVPPRERTMLFSASVYVTCVDERASVFPVFLSTSHGVNDLHRVNVRPDPPSSSSPNHQTRQIHPPA